MKDPVVILGMGEMGGVFARGFLRAGHPIYPVTRNMDLAQAAKDIPEPALVLVAVAENDLHPVLEKIPAPWAGRLVLLQNELLPRDWEQYDLDPTVISVWFEKKKGMDAKVIIPSPVYGTYSGLIATALNAIEIPTRVLDSADDLLFELVVKNLYILTSNICGLKVGGTVGELWQDHETFARGVISEILALQEWMTGQSMNEEALIQAMLKAFAGDTDHKCMGRSAPARLERALGLAKEAGIDTPELKAIQAAAR
jgi:ketopantoate reductase